MRKKEYPRHKGVCDKQAIMLEAAQVASRILVEADDKALTILHQAREKARKLVDAEMETAKVISVKAKIQAQNIIEDAVLETFVDTDKCRDDFFENPTKEEGVGEVFKLPHKKAS